MNSNSRHPLLSAAAIAAMVPALALALSVAMAQSYSVEGRTTAGGGGVSSGGAFSVSGTSAGQPDAGNSSGGAFTSAGGFWAIVSVLQVLDAPPLAFRPSSRGLVVFWPLPDDGLLLETTPNLNDWTDVPPATYETDGVSRFVRVGKPGSIRFFRLHRPPASVPPP